MAVSSQRGERQLRIRSRFDEEPMSLDNLRMAGGLSDKPRRCRSAGPMIEVVLPQGLDLEGAQRICTDALVSLVAERQEAAR